MKRKFSPPKFAIFAPIQILRDSTVISENDEDSTMKSELYDDSVFLSESHHESSQIYEAPILNSEIRPDSPQNPLIRYDLAQILDLLHRSDLHVVNMQVHISICVEIYRPPVEEASCSYVPDSEEFVPETKEHLMMVMDEFVPETNEASMTAVENFVSDTEDQMVMAMEIEAQGGDWRAEVANSMLQILLPRYFELTRLTDFLHTWNLLAASFILPLGIFPSVLHSRRNFKT